MLFNFQKLVTMLLLIMLQQHFDKQYFVLFINCHLVIILLKQSSAALRIHHPAGWRVSKHSAQHSAAHITGCEPAVQISS